MIKKSQKGVILIIAFLTLGILLFLGSYFLSFTITESKISKSQEISTKNYYLAEAGINKAIWKLKNDETTEDGDDPWKICFVTTTAACPDCNNWSASFAINTNSLVPNSSVLVSIKNTSCARGELIATSTIELAGGKTAQRVVKTIVFKSLASPTEGAAVFSGGPSENIDIHFSKIRIYGNLFSNNNLNIKFSSVVEVNATGTAKGKILVENNYNKDASSDVSAHAICAKNVCNTTSTCECEDSEKFQGCTEISCPPKEIATPIVDFDSDSPNSFKSRAKTAENAGQCQILCNSVVCSNKCVLDDDEFEDLLWSVGEGGTLTLNTTTTPGITYVEGFVELRGGRHLVVNGALVADDNIKIGKRSKWKGDEGFSQITVNRPTATTSSGLLTKRKIDFGPYSSFTTTSITGIIYASDEISLTSLPKSFIVKGGIIGRKLDFTSVRPWLNFILDDEIILYGLGYIIDGTPIIPIYSPIITVEHWEEAY